DARYEFEVSRDGDPWQIDMRPAIASIVQDVLSSKPTAWISAAFHNTIAAIIVEVCNRLRAEERLDRVCLSGGTCQNLYYLARAVAGLRARGFEVLLPAKVP